MSNNSKLFVITVPCYFSGYLRRVNKSFFNVWPTGQLSTRTQFCVNFVSLSCVLYGSLNLLSNFSIHFSSMLTVNLLYKYTPVWIEVSYVFNYVQWSKYEQIMCIVNIYVIFLSKEPKRIFSLAVDPLSSHFNPVVVDGHAVDPTTNPGVCLQNNNVSYSALSQLVSSMKTWH